MTTDLTHDTPAQDTISENEIPENQTAVNQPAENQAALFDTVLVANRGEIACRIIDTLHRLGIKAVAVYSEPDADAKHVREADEAVLLGPAAARESYLNIDAVIDAARRTGAQAIHPGYGFLSENVDFAAACEAAGIAFIGPSVGALETMADKIRAKNHVASHGVPVTPGVDNPNMSDEDLIAAADGVGYPLLIKPSAGGGGKGMTAVYDAAELPAALAGSRRVASSAFGDDTLFLERLIANPRHIEVQVLADEHGNVIHLAERECSLQRRHQKVIEEAPSALLTEEVRARIGKAACDAAASVNYRGAGTVEFLVPGDSPDEFFFMEMNTRLQVEHPVTEMVTGLDLVEEQVRIAAGLTLRITQDDVSLDGHSIEGRIYAENPAAGFLPTSGTIRELVEPTGPGVRVDSSLLPGGVVGTDYDPMLAKVIAHGATREEAIERLDAALADLTILGLGTNTDYLRALLADDDVRAGRLDTGLIERRREELGHELGASEVDAEQVAGIAVALVHEGSNAQDQPADARAGFRLGGAVTGLYLRDDDGVDRHVLVPIGRDADSRSVIVDGEPVKLAGSWTVSSAEGAEGIDVWAHGPDDGDIAPRTVHLTAIDRAQATAASRAARGREAGSVEPVVRTPMPGAVVAVYVQDGDSVTAGTPLLAVEAMKMEHALNAPTDGVVRLHAAVGDQLTTGFVVAEID